MTQSVKLAKRRRRKHTGCLWNEPRVCLSDDVTSLSRVREHLLKLLWEQSLPMRPGRIWLLCLHTAWAVIPEVPLNFPLSESRAALKPQIHRREERHDIMSRDSPINRVNFLCYIYTHFFFSRHSLTHLCWHTFTFFFFELCDEAQCWSSWLSNVTSRCFLPKMFFPVENTTFCLTSFHSIVPNNL